MNETKERTVSEAGRDTNLYALVRVFFAFLVALYFGY